PASDLRRSPNRDGRRSSLSRPSGPPDRESRLRFEVLSLLLQGSRDNQLLVMPVHGPSRDGVERFSVSVAKERWPEFLSLEHATLAPPLDFSREDEAVLVARAPVRGRRIRDGRIPTGCGAPLFLQAC